MLGMFFASSVNANRIKGISIADLSDLMDGEVLSYNALTEKWDNVPISSVMIGNDAVTNGKLANMAQNTIKGRISAGTGDPEDLTASQVRTIINVEDGANVTDAENVGSSIHGATAKSTPVDADTLPLIDSEAANVLKKVTWANIKATLAAAFNSVYAAAGNYFNKTFDDADDITEGATNKFATAAEKTKLGHITVTQAVDLDAIESRVNALDAAVVLVGVWDASAGTFPGGGAAQAGYSYIVSVTGTVDGVEFRQNDRVIAIIDNASTTTFAANWFKADYTDQVLSVNGSTGAVTLTQDEIGDGATYKQYSAADKTKLAGIEASADVTDAANVGAVNAAASSKATPVDADSLPLVDSEASNVIKRVTGTNLKAYLKTYFDTLYSAAIIYDQFNFAHISSTNAIKPFAKVSIAGADPSQVSSGTGGGVSTDPYVVHANGIIESITASLGGGSVSQGTVGSSPTARIDFYKMTNSGRTLLATHRIVFAAGTIGINTTPAQDHQQAQLTGLSTAISMGDIIGAEFVHETTDNNKLNAVINLAISVRIKYT